MSNAAIHAALDAVTDSLIGLATEFGTLEVFYENVGADPQDAEKAYLEVYFMPAPTAYVGLQGGRGQIFTGVYQLTLVTPPRSGTQAAEQIADEICDLFNSHPPLIAAGAAVVFPVPAYRSAAMNDEARSQTPITVMYSCCAG